MFVMKRGDVLVIQAKVRISPTQIRDLAQVFSAQLNDTGVKFIFLTEEVEAIAHVKGDNIDGN